MVLFPPKAYFHVSFSTMNYIKIGWGNKIPNNIIGLLTLFSNALQRTYDTPLLLTTTKNIKTSKVITFKIFLETGMFTSKP